MPIKFFNSLAHAPFYDTAVEFRGTRSAGRVATTVMCCLFENGFDAPLLEENVDTTRKAIGIAFPVSAWHYPTPPQVGELVRTRDTDYKVYRIEKALDDYHLTAREVE